MKKFNFKLTKDSCRRCGRNNHVTACCPNVVSSHLPHSDVVADAAAEIAAKRAAAAIKRDAAKEATRAAKEVERAVKVAVFESLVPFGVEVRNLSCFRGSNWDVEAVVFCKRCGKPEPKNGCWCM